MKKYDLKKIEQKLFENRIPKSMAGFDIGAFLSKHAPQRKREAVVLRPKEIEVIFESKKLAFY